MPLLNEPKKEVRKLLFVLFASVFCAFAFAGWTLWYYGATGEYFVRNVLISPEMLSNLSYQEDQERFLFDRVEISFGEKKQRIDHRTYTYFYDFLLKGVNIPSDPSLFVESVRITVFVKGALSGKERVFQMVEVQGGYFRVLLRQERSESPWAYFQREGIESELMSLL